MVALVIDVVDIDDIGESDEIGQCDRGNCTMCWQPIMLSSA